MALELGNVAMQWYNNKKAQQFQDGETVVVAASSRRSGPSFMNLIGLISMAFAAYLSWSKNSTLYPANTMVNALYAAGAGFFGGILYIIFYFISMRDLVEFAKKCKAAGIAI